MGGRGWGDAVGIKSQIKTALASINLEARAEETQFMRHARKKLLRDQKRGDPNAREGRVWAEKRAKRISHHRLERTEIGKARRKKPSSISPQGLEFTPVKKGGYYSIIMCWLKERKEKAGAARQ